MDEEPRTPEAERAREALGAAVREERPPQADAAFRARLREEFASGRIAGREPAGAEPARGARPDTARTPKGTTIGRLFRFPSWRQAAIAAAAAAAIVVAGLWNQGAAWRALPPAEEAPGIVVIDGIPTSTSDLTTLATALKPGAEIRVVEGGALRLASGDALALELPPGVQMTLPPPPSRWMERQMDLFSRAGEIRITTGPSFHGVRLSVHTNEAVVEVTGTTAAVIRDESGTCVCVLEGIVRMGAAPADAGGPVTAMASIPAGMRCLIYKDERPPLMEPISDMERTKLSMFRDAGHTLMAPAQD